MSKADLKEIKANLVVKKGWLGTYYIYLGQKFETEDSVQEFRRKKLIEFGLKPEILEQQHTQQDSKQETSLSDEVRVDESPTISIILVLVGFGLVLGSVFILANFWPENGPGADVAKVLLIGNGVGLGIFGLFLIGFAKIIGLLSQILSQLKRD